MARLESGVDRLRARGRMITLGASLALTVVAAGSLAVFVRQRLLDEALIREVTVSPYRRNPDRGRILDLVRSGASPNVDVQNGMTPLDYAVTTDDLFLIRVLLDRGANPNHRTARDQVALMHVKSRAAAEMLLSRGADPHFRYSDLALPMTSCIEIGTGSLDSLRSLLVRGRAVDETNSRGETGLMWLARSGRRTRIRQLLKMGADPGLRDHNGRTAADQARRQLQRESIPADRERLKSIARLLERAKKAPRR